MQNNNNKVELESFLISAGKAISNSEDKINVYKEKNNRIIDINESDYDYFIVEYSEANGTRVKKKIKADALKSYDYTHSYNDDVTTEVNPYANLTGVRFITNEQDGIINNGEGITVLLESLLSIIFKDFNYLVLPPEDKAINAIDTRDYIDDSFNGRYQIEGKNKHQNEAVDDKIYSIALKIKLFKKYNSFSRGVTSFEEFVPLKVYFRIIKNGDREIVDIDEDYTCQANLKDNKFTPLAKVSYSKQYQNRINQMLTNNDFIAETEKLNSKLDNYIEQVCYNIQKAVDNFTLDPKRAPQWFIKSLLGERIAEFVRNGNVDVEATTHFRYLTQTPLPYKSLRINARNNINSQFVELKQGPIENGINISYTKCPMCNQKIDSDNKLHISNEYDKNFVGCNLCMDATCNECEAKWNSNNEAPSLEYINKTYYKAGRCNSDFCNVSGCPGKNLCSKHSVKCNDPECSGKIYCENAVIKCNNKDCYNYFCLEHKENNIQTCKSCGKSYCNNCSEGIFKRCEYCNDIICSDCSIKTVSYDMKNEWFVESNGCVCKVCLDRLIENKKLNIENKVLFSINEENGYTLSAVNYSDVLPYATYKEEDMIFINSDSSFSVDAYINSKNGKKYRYRIDKNKKESEKDTHVCYSCREVFHELVAYDINGKTNYFCNDCIKTCSLCGRYALSNFRDGNQVIRDVFTYNGVHYCKNCCGKDNSNGKDKIFFNSPTNKLNKLINSPEETKWIFSGIDTNGEKLTNDYSYYYNIVFSRELTTDDELISKLVPYQIGNSNEKLFVCPETLVLAADNQCRNCSVCKEKYSILNYSGLNRSNLLNANANVICNICSELESIYSANNDKDISLLRKSFGCSKDDKVFCTENTLIIKKDQNIDLYHYDKKKSKYVKYYYSDNLGKYVK